MSRMLKGAAEEREAVLVLGRFSEGKKGSLSWVACLESRLVRVEEVVLVKTCRQLGKDCTCVLEISG